MQRRVPFGIAVLFAIDIALIAAPLVEFLLDSPFGQLRYWINLDFEATVPTWYSSVQWFCAAALFAVTPVYFWRKGIPGVLALAGLSLACLAFSLDEIIGIHEWLGAKSDALLPGGDRLNTVFDRTGIWIFVLGIPTIAVLAIIVLSLRRLLVRNARRAYRLLIVGLTIMFGGALLMELADNLIEEHRENRAVALLQVATEECLEMIGVTFIVWAAYALLRAEGFTLQAPAKLAVPQRSGRLRNALRGSPPRTLPAR